MVLFGAGRHAKEVITLLLSQGWSRSELICFAEYADRESVNGVAITINEVDLINHDRAVIATGGCSLRSHFFSIVKKKMLSLESIIADSACISEDALVGYGLNIMEFVYVGPNVRIGSGTLINTGSSVHHDVKIGSFCEIAPGVRLLGNCNVNESTMIGANATVLPDLSIGRNSIIGAGAVVTKDIPPNSVAVGVPAKVVKKVDSAL